MDATNTINERIEILVKNFGRGKNTVFGNLVGESEASIRGYRKSVIPKQPFLESVVRKFDVSANWLLTGRGEMLLSNELKQQKSDSNMDLFKTMLEEKEKKITELTEKIIEQAKEIGRLETELKMLKNGIDREDAEDAECAVAVG